MVLNDYGKLIILTAGLIAAVVLMMTDAIAPEAGVGIITGILGYITGNGRLAITGKAQSPMLAPAPPDV